MIPHIPGYTHTLTPRRGPHSRRLCGLEQSSRSRWRSCTSMGARSHCPHQPPATTATATTTTTATRTHPHPLPVLSCWPASAAARRAAICSNYYLNLPGLCNQKRSETIRLDQKRSSMRHTIVCRGRQHIDRASLGSWYYRCSRATGSSGCSGHGAGCPLPPHTPTRAHTQAYTHAHSQTDRQTDTYTYEHTHTSTYPPSFPHVGTRLLLLLV